MSNLRIIYPNPEGGVVVLIPALDCGLTVEQIAAKDVPSGIAFRIVEASVIPEGRNSRNDWKFETV